MANKQGALHETLERDETVSGPSERRFGLTFAVVFALIGLVSLWRHGPHAYDWLGGAALFAALALAWPASLKPLNKAWLKLGLALHTVMSPLIMGLMFFLVFTPMGLVMRLRGKDLLRLRRDAAAKSYWIMRNPPGPAPDSLKQQF
jgi:hypothetical protein